MGAKLLHADIQTAGRTWQIIVAFHNFSNIPKKDHIHFITVRMLVPYKANEPNMLSQLHTTDQTSILPSCSEFYLLVIFMRLQWQSVSQISSSLHKNETHTFLIYDKKNEDLWKWYTTIKQHLYIAFTVKFWINLTIQHMVISWNFRWFSMLHLIKKAFY